MEGKEEESKEGHRHRKITYEYSMFLEEIS
jgi:hypothetical protein